MTNQLFPENPHEVEEIPIQDGELYLYPYLFSPEERETFFTELNLGLLYGHGEYF